MTSLTLEVCKEAGVKPRDAERSKNFFALGLGQLALHPPDRADPRVDRQPVRRATPGGRGQHPGLPGRVRLRRDGRAVRVQLRGAAGLLRAGRVHQDHRQHGPGLGADRRRPPGQPAALPRQLPDHPGLGHPPRAVQAQGVRRPDLPGRGRDRRRRGRPRGRLRRVARGHHHQRARARPQVRDHRSGRQPRAAAPDRRHPARRPLDRAADQDRAGRPAPRHVRPPRRGPVAHRGRQDPVALLRGGHRGGPHRRQVPHAGHPALRRLPGQRGRAVAAARRRRTGAASTRASPPRPTTPTRTARRPSGRTCATRRRWPGPGRPRASPGSSTASAGWRRPTARATSPTTR